MFVFNLLDSMPLHLCSQTELTHALQTVSAVAKQASEQIQQLGALDELVSVCVAAACRSLRTSAVNRVHSA